jgi:hypothetical protein
MKSLIEGGVAGKNRFLKSHIGAPLKGPKDELFAADCFAHSKPVWITNLG